MDRAGKQSVIVDARSVVGLIVGATALAMSCANPDRDVDSVPATKPFISGARLRFEHFDVDGLSVLSRIFDVQLGEECTLGPWEPDGKRYCLPSQRGDLSWSFYFDSQCSEPLIDSYGCSPPDIVQSIDDTRAGGERQALYERGDELSSLGAFTWDRGRCVPSLKAAGHTWFRRGAEVPLARFVATRERVLDGHGRLAVLARHGDDGSVFRSGTWDTRRREAVYTYGTIDTPLPWVPASPAWLERGSFHDQACTQQVAYWVNHYALPVTAIVDGGSLDSYHERGARITGPLYTLDEKGGGCSPRPALAPSANIHFFKVGPRVPLAALEPARFVEVGEGRIRAFYRAGSDGNPLEGIESNGRKDLPGYHDTARSERCSFIELPDGAVRCLPASGYPVTEKNPEDPRFAGAPPLVLRVERGEQPPPTVTHLTFERSGCGAPAAVQSATVYVVGEQLAIASSEYDFFALRDTVPLDLFARATRVRD